MPFSCQLEFPALNGSPIEATLTRWKKRPPKMLERGDVIAEISIEGEAYLLCVNFACGLSAVCVDPHAVVKTGDRVAACVAEGEDISYGQDYLKIRR